MVFSIVRTTEAGSDIIVLETDQEGFSAEVATPQQFSRIIERMAGEGGIVKVISATTVEL